MSEKNEAPRTKDADQNPERISDPRAGLARLKEAMRRILRVPKERVLRDREEHS